MMLVNRKGLRIDPWELSLSNAENIRYVEEAWRGQRGRTRTQKVGLPCEVRKVIQGESKETPIGLGVS